MFTSFELAKRDTSVPHNYCHNHGDDGANWTNRQQYLVGENLTMQELRTLRTFNAGATTIKESAALLGIGAGGQNPRVMKLYHRGLLDCNGRVPKSSAFLFSITDEGKRRTNALSEY